MEAWREVWRKGFAPGLPTIGLEALKQALHRDDSRITQHATTVPVASGQWADWPAEGACAVSFCGWKGDGLETVAQVEEFFTRACFEADCRLGEPASCRWFLNWYDQTPRDEMRQRLLAEIERELRNRMDREIDWENAECRPMVAAA